MSLPLACQSGQRSQRAVLYCALLIGLLLLTPQADAALLLCPGIELSSAIHPALSGTEKRLVCGEKSARGKREGWGKIPKAQALFELRSFLQSRGYLNPKVSRIANAVRVDPGKVTRVRAVRLNGNAGDVDPSKQRGVIGSALTPKLLNSVQQWVRHALSVEGYPCAAIRATGDLKGTVTVAVNRGERIWLNRIESRGLETLDPRVLTRYYAFDFGDPYNSDLLALSADRAVADGVVERSFFVPVCPADVARQHSIEGGPRILTLGVSLNTEEVGVVQASLKRTRIGRNASEAFIGAQASSKIQELNTYYDWHFISPSARSSLRPLIDARHQNEDPFEQTDERIQAAWHSRWDWVGAGFNLLVGPQFDDFQTQRGSPASTAHQSSLGGELLVSSHRWEFNRNRFGGGFRMRMDFSSSASSALSSFGATLARIKLDQTWGLGNLNPPSVLLGLRLGYATTWIQGGMGNAGELPPGDYHYLGGDSDVRGFGRLELGSGYPNESLSAGFASVDVQPAIWGQEIQPFVFVDAGLLSYQSYSLKEPIFWSPGLGVNVKLPVGVVRSTLAHGFIDGNDSSGNRSQDFSASSHWQFFLSFGEPL